MHEPDFLSQLTALVDTPVIGLSRDAQLALIQAVCAERQRATGAPLPACRIVPFVTGRRPTTEIAHPGLGSSDNTSLIWGVPGRDENWAYILYSVTGLERYTPEECAAFALDVTLSFAGSDGSLHTAPLPGWDKRPLVPVAFADGTRERPTTQPIALGDAAGRNLVIALSPGADLLPGAGWPWSELDGQIRAAATDAADPFTFGALFSQLLQVSLRLTRAGVPVSISQTTVDV